MQSNVFIGHLYLQDPNGKIWAIRICPDGHFEQSDEFTEQEKLEIKVNNGASA